MKKLIPLILTAALTLAACASAPDTASTPLANSTPEPTAATTPAPTTAPFYPVANSYNNGDTYYAFAAASSQFDTGLPLDEVLMDYITTELKGVVGEQYAQPQGRITITLPAEEPTTPTKPESPKTADTGVVVYGLVAVMAAGAVVVMTSKKRKAI